MAIGRRRIGNRRYNTTGAKPWANGGSNSRRVNSSPPSRQLLRVYTTLKIPARAPRVKYVGALRPSVDGTSFQLRQGSSRSHKGPLVKRRVLLLIERPKRYDRFTAQVTFKAGKVHISSGARGEIASRASHLPEDRQDRKGRGKAGGHSASLHPGLGRVHRATLLANATSARRFDLASAYVLGRRVRG